MHTEQTISDLCKKYGLGELKCCPLSVEGGLLHRMYHVTTSQGEYAVKLLNSDIMKRPSALQNMINSERIAEGFAHRTDEAIPVVGALKLEGQHLLSLQPDQYAFAYLWLEAHPLFSPKIGVVHCRKIGRILGQIHHAELYLEEIEQEENHRPLYDWYGYMTIAKDQQVPWLTKYEAMLPNLTRWDRAATEAMESVASFQVISHRDLDPKNVLWQGTEPWIIDWEAAGYVNPYQELLEVLNYWGRDGDGNYSSALCQALLQEYTQYMDLQKTDWTPVFACSYDSMLGWLEYTLKKSLGLEGDDQARMQGPDQLLAAYAELQRYDAQTEILLKMLK
ncbi:MAG: phosphotransferase [Acetatifactor sp.]|nr:phosphotransferase [Acetatifactor sp.]